MCSVALKQALLTALSLPKTQLIKAEEQEHDGTPNSHDAQLPPLTNTSRYYQATQGNYRPARGTTQDEDYASSPSIKSRSTLSSATTTTSSNLATTPQQSAQLHRHQLDLQKKYDDEYEQLKQDRLKTTEYV